MSTLNNVDKLLQDFDIEQLTQIQSSVKWVDQFSLDLEKGIHFYFLNFFCNFWRILINLKLFLIFFSFQLFL